MRRNHPSRLYATRFSGSFVCRLHRAQHQVRRIAPGLRSLQARGSLSILLRAIRGKSSHGEARSVIKTPPTANRADLEEATRESARKTRSPGSSQTNCAPDRSTAFRADSEIKRLELSGTRATEKGKIDVARARNTAKSKIPLIASGGIFDVQSTGATKLEAGAQLLQVYTGYVYAETGATARNHGRFVAQPQGLQFYCESGSS